MKIYVVEKRHSPEWFANEADAYQYAEALGSGVKEIEINEGPIKLTTKYDLHYDTQIDSEPRVEEDTITYNIGKVEMSSAGIEFPYYEVWENEKPFGHIHISGSNKDAVMKEFERQKNRIDAMMAVDPERQDAHS